MNSLRIGEGWKEKDPGVIFTLYGDQEEKESETAITRDTGKSDLYWKEKSRADAFLSKPFKPQELVNQVEDLLAPESEEDR